MRQSLLPPHPTSDAPTTIMKRILTREDAERGAAKINKFKEDFFNYIASKPTTETRKRQLAELEHSDQLFDSAVSVTSHDQPVETKTIVIVEFYDSSRKVSSSSLTEVAGKKQFKETKNEFKKFLDPRHDPVACTVDALAHVNPRTNYPGDTRIPLEVFKAQQPGYVFCSPLFGPFAFHSFLISLTFSIEDEVCVFSKLCAWIGLMVPRTQKSSDLLPRSVLVDLLAFTGELAGIS